MRTHRLKQGDNSTRLKAVPRQPEVAQYSPTAAGWYAVMGTMAAARPYSRRVMPRARRVCLAAVAVGTRRLEEMKMLAAKERPTRRGRRRVESGTVRLGNHKAPEHR